MKKTILYNPTNSFEVKTWDVEYLHHAGQAWLARIYQPKSEGPFIGLLDVHGGVWNRGDRTQNSYIDEQLAASGLLVAALDFRLAPQYPYPAQVADTNLATRWFKAHTQEFNIYPDYLGIMGTSSGGHTAMLSAMRSHDTYYMAHPLPKAPTIDATVNWIIALWPVIDPYARYLYAQEVGREDLVIMTKNYFLTEETMEEGNPQLLLDRKEKVQLPPVLVVQGTSDANVPLSISKRFATSYREARGELDLELFPDMPHGFARQPSSETKRALEIIKIWIAHQVNTKKSIST